MGTVIQVLQSEIVTSHIGDPNATMDAVIKDATNFIGSCFGYSNETCMSDIRFKVWTRKMAKQKGTSVPHLKSLPPTDESFQQNVKRAHFKCCIWKHASLPNPPSMDPSKYGWVKDEDSKSLSPITIAEGIQIAPAEVLLMIRCSCANINTPCSTTRMVVQEQYYHVLY